MKTVCFISNRLLVLAAVTLFSASLTTASADEPCPGSSHYDEFGECKVLVEINSTDGDIGFHFLIDGDNLIRNSLFNPHWRKIFSYYTRREAREQTLTETFAESAEPLCWYDADEHPDEDPEDVVTLEDFIDLWKQGRYYFLGVSNEYDLAFGYTRLDFDLPAAPLEVEYETDVDGDDIEGEISWEPGEDLGECADSVRLQGLVDSGDLPSHPEDVEVAAWEVVLEPDFEDDDENSNFNSMKFVVRIPGDGCDDDERDDEGQCEEFETEVSDDYLETLPENTPAKAEVGAIGFGDNATFTEIDEICLNDSLFPDMYEEGINEDGEEALFNGCGFEVEDDD